MLQSSFLRGKLLNKQAGKQFPANRNWDPLGLGLDKNSAKALDKPAVSPVMNEKLSELTEQILETYKSCREYRQSLERSQFISNLAGETQQCLSDLQTIIHHAKRTQDAYEEATASLMEIVFDQMRSYAFEFNSAVGFSEMHITCTKPSLVTEVLRYSSLREPVETMSNLRARLSTRHFSLVIIGRAKAMEFFLMPVQKVIGLTKSEANYSPKAKFEAGFDGQSVSWQFDRQVLTNELLERVCRDLFRQLVETSRVQSQGHL
jgi:hypothetical protein